MQGFITLATISSEKHTLVFKLTPGCKILTKSISVKCRSRIQDKGVCLYSMSRTITMQGFTILAFIGTEKISVTEVDRRTKCQMDGRMDGQKHKLAICKCDNNT